MKYIVRIYVYLFLIFISGHCFAQNQLIRFESIDVKQGLSNNFVTCSAEDSLGFIWFGTHDGLNRYDGYTFKKYYHNDSSSNSIPDNFITALTFTSGKLWIGTAAGGMCSFDPQYNKFVTYSHQKDSVNSIDDNQIKYILEDPDSPSEILWIGTSKGLNKFNVKTNEYTNYSLPENEKNKNLDIGVNVIYKDKNGILWLGTNFGLYTFYEKTNRWQQFTHNTKDINSISDNRITSIVGDKSGNIFIGTLNGLNAIERVETTVSEQGRFSLSVAPLGEGITKGFRGTAVLSIFEDKDQNLWVGTYSGVNKIAVDRKSSNYYNHSDYDNLSVASNTITTIMQNKSGAIWFGTGGDGISQFNPNWSAFNYIRHILDFPNSLSGRSTRGIYLDDENFLWVGGYEGLNKIDRQTGSNKHLNQFNSEITSDLIYAITPDTKNKDLIWLGSEGGGLIKYNKRTGKAKTYTSAKYIPDTKKGTSPSSGFILSIYCDQEGLLWIATGNGLNIFNPQTEIFTYFQHNKFNQASIAENQLKVIYEDRQGRIWVGTASKGVDVYDRVANSFRHIGQTTSGKSRFGSDRIYSIFQDSKGFFWIGTFGGGLTKIDFSNESNPVFSTYTTNDGLPNDIIYGILEDDSGNLWLSTNLGISKFDPQNITFKNYNEGDGLQSNEFNSASYYKSKKGEMFFGGINGVNSFFPGQIDKNKYNAPVVLTDFRLLGRSLTDGLSLDGRDILNNAIAYSKDIELRYSDNILTFEFAALNFLTRQRQSYAYRLFGFDHAWNYTTTGLREARYTNIPPGSYTFKIVLANNIDDSNEKGVSLNIIIDPPWWYTWWAWLIYIAIIVTAVYFIRKYEIARLSLKNQLKFESIKAEHLEELDQMKTDFFTNISHEIKTPLSLLVDPIDKLISMQLGKGATSTLKVMKKNTRRMKEIVDQILQINKLENKTVQIKVNRRDIFEYLKEITSKFTSQLQNKRIELITNLDEGVLFLYYNIDMIDKIFSNLLSNAIKFTPEGGQLTINLSEDKSDLITYPKGSVKISVKDNGCGIEKGKVANVFNRFYQAHEKTNIFTSGIGIGLSLVKEFVELHSGKVEVFSTLNVGTEFIVTLPLGNLHLTPDQIEKPEQPTIENSILASEETDTEAEQLPNADVIDDYETTILIIDDSRDMLSYLRSILFRDYAIIEAENGKTGLAKTLEFLPDLIVTDLTMPEMNGIELCDILKNDVRTSHIPIIMLTAKSTLEEKINGLKVGADAYIPKPFSSSELVVSIGNLIKQRRKLREIFETQHEYKIKEIAVTPADEKFLHLVLESIEKHLSEPDFNVEDFRDELGFSKVQFIRKIKSLTGKSPNKFMRHFRLQRAAQLIKQDFGSISEIAYKVGFENLNYFSKSFKEQFDCTPSEYKNKVE